MIYPNGFSIIEHNKNQFSFLPNDVILIINLNNQLDIYYVMAKKQSIYAVENTIKKLHIVKDMHIIYKQDFYKDKQK